MSRLVTRPQTLVEEFIRSWSLGLEDFCASVSARFTAETVWENVGYSVTTGAEDNIAHLRESAGRLGWSTVDVDTVAIATAGDTVLTERVDHHLAPDGRVLFSVRCASAFDVAGERITGIREYFDTAPLVAARDRAAMVAD